MRYKDLIEDKNTNEHALHESDGATCAANVATVAQPFFSFQPEQPKKEKKSRKGKPIVLKRTSGV